MEALSKNDNQLSNEDFLSIREALPPSCTIILQKLYQTPNLQHKALAADTHMTITNLSNCIDKIEKIWPSLLRVEKIGRSKFYSLSKIAEQYVEKTIFQNQPAKIHPFTSLPSDASKTNETIQFLHRFCENAGQDWDITLFEMLSNPNNKDCHPLSNIFSSFIDNIVWFKVHQKSESLQNIYAILEQPILIKKLEQYLNQLLKKYYILEPLFNLEKYDVEKAFFIIDNMFSRLDATETFESFDFQPLLEEQYNKIFLHMTDMIRDFHKYNSNKKDVIQHWKTTYRTVNPILLYIAEKCFSLEKYQNLCK